MDIAAEFMSAIINAFEANKRLADRAVAQVPDDKLHVALDENTNSIAVIMKHVAGNLTSRWTDFLTTDGEKAWRDRDQEFVARAPKDDGAFRKELASALGIYGDKEPSRSDVHWLSEKRPLHSCGSRARDSL